MTFELMMETVYPATPADEARFWAKVAIGHAGDCWRWLAAHGRYGQFYLSGKNRAAHRVAYAWCIGEIPAGLVLDHLCRETLCVNPLHLEPVTQRENARRGVGMGQANTRKTHCPRGHEYTPENTYLQVYTTREHRGHGGRSCKACRRIVRDQRGAA